jgi:hypothetical protein
MGMISCVPDNRALSALDVLDDAYQSVTDLIRSFDDEVSWRLSGCHGWSIRDLVFHCLGDAQRGLVALHTPSDHPLDRDATTYWQDWAPDPVGSVPAVQLTGVARR